MSKTYTLLLFIFVVLASNLQAQNTGAITGSWKTIDDETGETKSVVEIYEQDGKYFGRIASLQKNKDARCTECSGKKKDQPIVGLVIIEDLKKDGDSWSGGSILDPQKGATYKLSAWFDEDPNTLYIRGKHWTGLYRTQTWTRN
ncbi:DUF2147 domain-containing protein [Neolewinella aurantiaca]|uniref:DUF2147 domain-containing protein n=1 Tax=Neolewinella aurantiaca TaxID=2602767 RepID=A0A5C7FI53_9BACT|nr:DUF2147 domain-containing protein [Neolewinella aurantiaca]TXF90825.1 DUF2147 domain-containing protein [Neolewinella aurantiaca]